MPIRPKPTTYTCPSCGWRKTTIPISDALVGGDIFKKCPKCGHIPLDSCPASPVAGVFAKISKIVR